MENDKKWYKSFSNWLIIIACIILIPALLINVYIMIQSASNKDEVPSVFGIKPFIVLSGSMETEIYKGDLIITKIVDPSTLKVNDVIAFRDTLDTVTTHRIIDIIDENGNKLFITKGDNNHSQDQSLVEFKDVEGIYLFRIPGVGSMMNTLSQPTTIIILVFGITLIFVVGFLIANKKETEKERQEFLEYKRMKELEQENAKKKQTKKKAEKDDAIKEVKEVEKKKTTKTTSKKKTSKK